MATYLFDVAELFELRDRGLVVVANRTYRTLDPDMKPRIGDEIEFRRPSSTEVRSLVAGIEHFDPWSPDHAFAFQLSPGVSKDQVRIGDQVWQIGRAD